MKMDHILFGVIDAFVSDELKRIFHDFLQKTGKNIVSPTEDGFEQSIPLILCDERASFMQRRGIFCPYEFILERRDLLPLIDEKGKFASKPMELMVSRLETLANLYGGNSFTDALRDWFAGAFRMYLMLDETTHGTSEFIDLEKVKKKKDPILWELAYYPDYSNEKKRLSDKNAARSNVEEKKLLEKYRDIVISKCYGDIKDKPKEQPDYIENNVESAHRHAEILYKRFVGETLSPGDSPCMPPSLAKKFFSDYFDENHEHSVVKALSPDITAEKRFEALCSIYCDTECWPQKCDDHSDRAGLPREHDERLPVAFGDRAKYVTPSGKLNLLLIDDNVGDSPFGHLKEENMPSQFEPSISKNDWKLLCELFNVQALQIDKGDIFDVATQYFRKFQKTGLTYDLILVDLCLGNNHREDDLAGYTMIQIVRAFFPGTPIVVYSRFSDMEHIARAFDSGAKWFLIKGEEAKLPRHVLKLLRQVGWHREWKAVNSGSHAPEFLFDKDDYFARRFKRTEQWKYLTYKCLESFPGKYIHIKKMGGGISSAATFKAVKGVKLDGEFLQTPNIIKIDESFNTMMEFERYFRMIRPYIANEAGRVEMPERVLNRTYSSIVYTFAGKQDKAHTLESMWDMLDDNVRCQTACDYETYRYALQCIFDEILPKIHRVSPELEQGDIVKPNVQSSEMKDAFAWKEVHAQVDGKAARTSFPNFYYDEILPSEFWQSYVMRMQPWGRFNIDIKDNEQKLWPFMVQETFPQSGDIILACDKDGKDLENIKTKLARLIFHDIMTDPFADADGKMSGKRLIKAYTADRKQVWLEGDACHFMARFRTRVAPGTSLWLEKADWMDEKGNLKENIDWRLEWLRNTFELKKEDHPTAKDDFVKVIGRLTKIANFDIEHGFGELTFYVKLQDEIIEIAKETANGKAKEWRMTCPMGIIHGDLNVKNIMLESRNYPPKEDDPDMMKTVSDVWLIDFARTHRDLIAHDFNVFFTSVLGELFTEELIGKEGRKMSKRQEEYWEKLVANFKVIVSSAVKPESKSEKDVPDEIKDDQRFTLIYRILRRTHDAAIKADVSQNMYLLTTALTCLYVLKIFLNNGCKVRLAAGCFAAAWICYDILCKDLELDNVMEKYKSCKSKKK